MLEGFDDEPSLIDLLARTSARFESSAGGDWRFDPDNPAERVQVRGISGFRLRPTRVQIKDKLNQNHPRANRESVITRLQQQDNAGGDEKLLCVPVSTTFPYYDKVKTYKDMPEIVLQQIEHFFAHYKDLEPGKWVKLGGWGDVDEAKQIILDGIERARAAEV